MTRSIIGCFSSGIQSVGLSILWLPKKVGESSQNGFSVRARYRTNFYFLTSFSGCFQVSGSFRWSACLFFFGQVMLFGNTINVIPFDILLLMVPHHQLHLTQT